MAGRQISLRNAATCSSCGTALAARITAWWDAGAKTVRCEACGETPPAPRGVAGGSAMQKVEDKRSRREAAIRAAHPRFGGFLLAMTDEPQDIKNWEKGAVGEQKLGTESADVPVWPMLCFVDGDWRWFAKPFELAGVLVAWPRAARDRVSGPGPLSRSDIDVLARRLDERLRPAS